MVKYPQTKPHRFTCDDRGLSIGIPADFPATEALMAIYDNSAIRSKDLWESYGQDLRKQLAAEGIDAFRLFTIDNIRALNRSLNPNLGHGADHNNLYGHDLSHKSLAAMAILTVGFWELDIDWSTNPVVAMRAGRQVRALNLLSTQLGDRVVYMKKVFEQIQNAHGKAVLSQHATQTAEELLTPVLTRGTEDHFCFLEHSGSAANLLALFMAGAQLDPDKWNGAKYSEGPRVTLVHLLVQSGDAFQPEERDAILKNLLAQGHSVESSLKRIKQPLRVFAAQNDAESVKQLLRAGVSLDKKDGSGKTARDIALAKGHNGIVALLDAEAAQRVISSRAMTPSIKPL